MCVSAGLPFGETMRRACRTRPPVDISDVLSAIFWRPSCCIAKPSKEVLDDLFADDHEFFVVVGKLEAPRRLSLSTPGLSATGVCVCVLVGRLGWFGVSCAQVLMSYLVWVDNCNYILSNINRINDE